MFLTSTNACSPSEPFVGNIPRTLTCDATALSCWSTIIRASHLVVCQDCDTKIMVMIIDQLWQNPATWLSSRNSCASLSLFTSTARAEVLDRSQSTSVSFSRPLFCLKHHPKHNSCHFSFMWFPQESSFSHLVCRCQQVVLPCTTWVKGNCGPAFI